MAPGVFAQDTPKRATQAEALFQRGQDLLLSGDFNQAKQSFREALDLGPAASLAGQINLHLAMVFLAESNPHEARQAVMEALKDDPALEPDPSRFPPALVAMVDRIRAEQQQLKAEAMLPMVARRPEQNPPSGKRTASAPVPARAEASSVAPNDRSWSWQRWAWLGTGVLTLVGAGAAIAMGLSVLSERDKANQRAQEIGARAVVNDEPFAALESSLADKRTTTNVLWGVTAGLGLVTAAFLTWDLSAGEQGSAEPATQKVVQIRPWAGNSMGADAIMRF